ncbi:MAG: sodium transporter, partial [Olleya sp.]
AGSIEGTVIEVINKISSVFYGPILAAFILAILTKKTHALAANIGIVVGVAFNIILWLYVPEIFWFWWNAIGCLVTIIVALLVTYVVRREANEGLEVVIYKAGKKEVILLLSYFIVICIIAMSMVKLLS